jgi:hypothetical protein
MIEALKPPTQNNHCQSIRAACAAMRKDGASYEHSRWQRAPAHHRKLLVTLAGLDDAYAARGWDVLPVEAKQSICSIAREMSETMQAVKAFQR